MRKIFTPRLAFFAFLILSLLMATSASAATITAGQLYSPVTCPSCGVSGTAKVTVAPTCIKDGVGVMTNRACSCAATVTIPASAFTNHSWVSATVDATCTTPGKTGSRCEYCLTWRSDATTIPVTAHTMSAWAAKDNTSHSRFCTVAGCSYTECEDHKGGTATCASKAICEVCGRAYGSASSMHDWKLTSQDATQHTYTCSVCQRTKSEAHDWGAWTSTSSSMTHIHTCTQCGEIVRAAHSFTYAANGSQHTATCSDCGYSFSESHDLPDTWYVNPSNSAQHMRRCTKCNAGDRQGHTWGSWVCNDDGTHTRTCTANGCGATETAKCSYVWQKASTPGYHTKYCATCGDYSSTGACSGGTATCMALAVCDTCGLTWGEYGDHMMSLWLRYDDDTHRIQCNNDGCTYEEFASHTFGDWFYGGPDYHQRNCSASECSAIERQPHNLVVISSDESTHTLACSVCGTASTTSNHTWGEWVTTDPTCYEDGSKTRTCSVCGTSESEGIPTTGHPGTRRVIATPATCGADGLAANVCYLCGDTVSTEVIPATGNHTWGSWASAGSSMHARTCSVCGETGRDTHSLSDWTDAGSAGHQKTCSDCDYVNTADHTFPGWVADNDTTCSRGVCTTCGGGKPLQGNHEFGAWENNGAANANTANHKRSCTRCGYTQTQAHTFPGWVADNDTTCSRGVCTTCGGGKPLQGNHEFGAWSKTATTHSHTCTRCNRTVTANHSGGSNSDCKTQAQCTTCYAYYGPYGPHIPGDPVTTPATCTTDGKNETFCGICHELLSSTVIAKKGHNFTNLVSHTAPTCTKNGADVYDCTRCDEKEITVLPKLDHNLVTTNTPPTCTEWGKTTTSCTRCDYSTGNTPNSYPPLGHDFTNLVSHTDPTCTQDGADVYDCTRCDEKEITVLPKLDHNLVTTNTPPTCTEWGKTTVSCTRCDYSTGSTPNSYPPLGHDFTNLVSHTDPTCTQDGEDVNDCTRCDEIETTVLPMFDHVEGNPITYPEPTCCDKGLKSWYCVNCNTLLRTEELDPLGHDANFKWVTVTEPTCTEEGLEKKVCAHSGKDLGETRTIPALGHIYVGLWEVGESDTHHRDCYRCGAGRRNVECTYLPLIIDDVEYQVCPVCGRFHNQKLEVVAEADITIVTGSKPGVSLVRMLADPFGADEIRYPAIMTAIFEADGYIADPDQNVTGITVILPVDAMASFKLVFVHMDDATGELVWTDVPYTLENGILTFAVEEMGLFLFVAE